MDHENGEDALPGTDGRRVLYDINDDDCCYTEWGDRADRLWDAYQAAIAAGTVLRWTETHALLGGVVEVVGYDDPVSGSRRFAVITARDPGSDYRVVDHPERGPAEAAYEREVYAHLDDEFPYRSSDVFDVRVDRRSKPPAGVRVLPSGTVVATEDLEEYDNLYGLPLGMRWPATATAELAPAAVQAMAADSRLWGPAEVRVREVTPAAWAAADDALRPNDLALLGLPDGRRLLASAHDDAAHVWGLGDGQGISTAPGHSEWVLSVALAALGDGRVVLATGGKDGLARAWSARDGVALQEIQAHRGPVNSLAWALPPGRLPLLVTGGDDASVRLWDVETGRSAGEFAVGAPGVHLVWSVATAVLSDHHVCVAAAVPGDEHDVVHVWDATGMTRLHEFAVERAGRPFDMRAMPRVAVAALADRSFRVAAVAGPGVRIWDGHTGEVVRTLPPPDDDGRGGAGADVALAVLPGLRVAVAATGRRRTVVWDAESGAELTRVEHAVDGPVVSVELLAAYDGGLLLVTGRQGDAPASVRRLDIRW